MVKKEISIDEKKYKYKINMFLVLSAPQKIQLINIKQQKLSSCSKSIECRQANVGNTKIDQKLGKRTFFDGMSNDQLT